MGRDSNVHYVAKTVDAWLRENRLTPHDGLSYYCRSACGLDAPSHFMPIYKLMREHGCSFDLV